MIVRQKQPPYEQVAKLRCRTAWEAWRRTFLKKQSIGRQAMLLLIAAELSRPLTQEELQDE